MAGILFWGLLCTQYDPTVQNIGEAMVNLKPSNDFYRINSDTDPLAQFVSPLIAYQRGRTVIKSGQAVKKEWWSAGSMIWLSDNLGLTARHILDDHATKIDLKPMPYNHFGVEGPLEEDLPGKTISGRTYQLQTVGMVDGELGRWDVQIHPLWHTDIAFLYLSPINEAAKQAHLAVHPVLNLFPAPIGSEVVAVGLPNFKIRARRSNITLSYKHYLSRGTTYAISHDQETKQGWFPAFHFDGRLEQGMSGGAVFTQASGSWILSGVISKTVPAENGKPPRSTAATLWPIVLQDNIDMGRAGLKLPFNAKCTVQQLAQMGVIKCAGFDEFIIVPDKQPGWGRLILLDPVRVATGRTDHHVQKEHQAMNISIRDCSSTDLSSVLKIEKDVYFEKAWQETTFASYLGQSDRSAFIAENDVGVVVGYIFLEVQPEEAYIANLAVQPDLDGMGIGSQLLDKVKAKYKRLALEVEADNSRAIRFYYRRGFTVTNLKPKALIMEWLRGGRVINVNMVP